MYTQYLYRTYPKEDYTLESMEDTCVRTSISVDTPNTFRYLWIAIIMHDF